MVSSLNERTISISGMRKCVRFRSVAVFQFAFFSYRVSKVALGRKRWLPCSCSLKTTVLQVFEHFRRSYFKYPSLDSFQVPRQRISSLKINSKIPWKTVHISRSAEKVQRIFHRSNFWQNSKIQCDCYLPCTFVQFLPSVH